jgi:hypothetical protein
MVTYTLKNVTQRQLDKIIGQKDYQVLLMFQKKQVRKICLEFPNMKVDLLNSFVIQIHL